MTIQEPIRMTHDLGSFVLRCSVPGCYLATAEIAYRAYDDAFLHKTAHEGNHARHHVEITPEGTR